jgi:hypothetical protein
MYHKWCISALRRAWAETIPNVERCLSQIPLQHLCVCVCVCVCVCAGVRVCVWSSACDERVVARSCESLYNDHPHTCMNMVEFYRVPAPARATS